MKPTNYLLMGGGLASSQAAKQLREQDPESVIILAGEDPYIPYDRPPLSKEFCAARNRNKNISSTPSLFSEIIEVASFLERLSSIWSRPVRRLAGQW